MKVSSRRRVRTFNLIVEAHRQEFEEVLNNPNVLLDISKDVQYFFDDKSGRIMAVVYYTELEPAREPVLENPKAILAATEEAWRGDDE
jgi:hypothetical protein